MSRTIKLRNRSSKRRYRLSKRRYTRKKTARKYKVKKPKHKRRTRKITRRKYRGGLDKTLEEKNKFHAQYHEETLKRSFSSLQKKVKDGAIELGGAGLLSAGATAATYAVVASSAVVAPPLWFWLGMGTLAATPWKGGLPAILSGSRLFAAKLKRSYLGRKSRYKDEEILWKFYFKKLMEKIINDKYQEWIHKIENLIHTPYLLDGGNPNASAAERIQSILDVIDVKIRRIYFEILPDSIARGAMGGVVNHRNMLDVHVVEVLNDAMELNQDLLLECCLLAQILIRRNISPWQLVWDFGDLRERIPKGSEFQLPPEGSTAISRLGSLLLLQCMDIHKKIMDKNQIFIPIENIKEEGTKIIGSESYDYSLNELSKQIEGKGKIEFSAIWGNNA